jgi:methylated-DNA-[protein]-cysteine S-methyltransferase
MDGLSGMRSAVVPTPVGLLALAVDEQGTVVSSGFAPQGVRPTPDLAAASPGLAHAIDAVIRYFDGDLSALDEVAVATPDSTFEARVHERLRSLPPGQRCTYKELAGWVGQPAAARAVGSACARNETVLFVPCHRVTPASGDVGSYKFGSNVKAALLAHEGAAP